MNTPFILEGYSPISIEWTLVRTFYHLVYAVLFVAIDACEENLLRLDEPETDLDDMRVALEGLVATCDKFLILACMYNVSSSIRLSLLLCYYKSLMHISIAVTDPYVARQLLGSLYSATLDSMTSMLQTETGGQPPVHTMMSLRDLSEQTIL